MEKQKAHYDLSAVKARVEAVGMDAFSLAAKVGARNMSLTEEEALEVVMGLKAGCCTRA
jgi:hypothetical protein